jgi:hypothetical protein
MTVWIYVNTAADVGDVDHLKVFASEAAANAWFAENDPEGVAFEYAVLS